MNEVAHNCFNEKMCKKCFKAIQIVVSVRISLATQQY